MLRSPVLCPGRLQSSGDAGAAQSFEGLPEELSLEELEQHIRVLQLEIARSDAAEAESRTRMTKLTEQGRGSRSFAHASLSPVHCNLMAE